MSLVKCPDCGIEISDRSDVCIHCGYPIGKLGIPVSSEEKEQGICYVNGKPYDLSGFLPMAIKDAEENTTLGEMEEIIKKLQGLTGLKDAQPLYLTMAIEKEIPDKWVEHSIENTIYTPKCPTCGSGNIKTLGFFERGGWAPKTFGCNNCGYEW